VFRILLTIILAYLVIRYILKIFSPARRSDSVAGRPPKPRKPLDDDRIQDASFKDIPDK
jgi:hypothetical protein